MTQKAPIPPRKVIENQTWFEAVNLTDTEDRFKVQAESEVIAKKILLDKLGFYIRKIEDDFVLFDADDDEPKAVVHAHDEDDALNQVLKVARWSIQEPTFFVGGTTDMNEDTDDTQ